MNQENTPVLSTQDEECANLLITIGMKRNIARVLVYFVTTKAATSRDIEQATGLRQPEVSLALQYLAGRQWVTSRAGSSSHNGRPNKIYELSQPLGEIMDSIQEDKKREVENSLQLITKLKGYAGT